MADRKKLYDNLLKSNKITTAEIGDFDTFNSLLSDSTNAAKLYKNLTKDGLFTKDELGDEQTFISLTIPDRPMPQNKQTKVEPPVEEKQPGIQKIEWKGDPIVEGLKAREDVAAWTSAENFANYRVKQENEYADLANKKIQEFEYKGQQLPEKHSAEVNILNEQYKTESDALAADYKTKSEKINEKYEKSFPKAKTKQEYDALRKEQEQALQSEYEAYTAKFTEREQKYKEQYQKLSDGFNKEKEQYNKEAEALNKEFTANGEDRKVRTKLIDPKSVGDIQSYFDNAPNDYAGKKEFVRKYVDEAVDDYIYKNGEANAKQYKEELYAVINEKLLFDKDGKVTNYALKNQAEIGKQKLRDRFNEISAKKIEWDRKAGIRPGQYPRVQFEENPYAQEFANLAMAVENYDKILAIPEPKKAGDKSGSFFGGLGDNIAQTAINVFTNGFAEMMKSAHILDIAGKSKSGEPLSESEQAILDSMALMGTATEKLSEGTSSWYKAGAAGAKSIEWMTSMATTSGIYNSVFKGVLKKLGYKVGQKAIMKNLPKFIVAEAAGALARVPAQVPFYTDVIQRNTNIKAEQGAVPGTVSGKAYLPEESFGKTVVKGIYSQWAENFGEMGGKYLDLAGKAGKAKVVELLAKKFNLGVFGKVGGSKVARGIKQATSRLGIDQPFGELGEEKISEILHWVDGSTKPEDFFDREQNWVTFLSVATMIAPFQTIRAFGRVSDEKSVTDFLNKDQINTLNSITGLKDIQTKAKKLGQFVLDNDLQDNFDQQEMIAKYVWDSQQNQVAEEMNKPQTETLETDGRYSHGNFEVSREVAQEAIENADSIEELQQIGIAETDLELKKQAAAKANTLTLLEQEEKRFDKEIEDAGVNEAQLEQVQKEHAKRKALILSGKQIEEPVKEKETTKDTEIKTEISDTQLTPELTGETKVEGVKETVQPELSKVGKDLKKQFDQFSKKAKNALPTVIVDSIDQLPTDVRQRMGKLSENAKVQAFVDPKTNTAYFVAQNIPKDKVLAKWVHEQGIHRGMEVLMPNQKDRSALFNKVFDSVGVDKIKASLPKVYGAKFDKGSLSKEGIAEEYMAHLAEKIITEKDLTPEEKSVWQKIKEYIEKIIRKTYGKAKLTDKEIAEVIRASVKSIYSEEKVKPKQSIQDYIENNKTEIFSQLKANGTIKVKGEC